MCKLHLVTLFALLSAGQYTPTELPLSAQNQLQVTFPASGVTVRSAGQQLTTSRMQRPLPPFPTSAAAAAAAV